MSKGRIVLLVGLLLALVGGTAAQCQVGSSAHDNGKSVNVRCATNFVGYDFGGIMYYPAAPKQHKLRGETVLSAETESECDEPPPYSHNVSITMQWCTHVSCMGDTGDSSTDWLSEQTSEPGSCSKIPPPLTTGNRVVDASCHMDYIGCKLGQWRAMAYVTGTYITDSGVQQGFSYVTYSKHINVTSCE
jgi:hypothetical protein